jgi:hypothetical protein
MIEALDDEPLLHAVMGMQRYNPTDVPMPR